LFGKPKIFKSPQIPARVLVSLWLAGLIGRKKKPHEKTISCDRYFGRRGCLRRPAGSPQKPGKRKAHGPIDDTGRLSNPDLSSVLRYPDAQPTSGIVDSRVISRRSTPYCCRIAFVEFAQS
jgi:hypothetical protein